MKVFEMTGSEYDYFKLKDKECKAYTKKEKTKKGTDDFLWILGGLGVIIGLVLTFALTYKGMH